MTPTSPLSTLPPLDPRLAAVCDLSIPAAPDGAGRHEYDGTVQDLSPDAVRRGLAALGGPAGTKPYPDPHDEAHAAAAEEALRVRFGELELHRSNPLWHIENLDLTGYDRPYAPEAERDAARSAQLRPWPDAVDAAIEALDRVPAGTPADTVRALQADHPDADSLLEEFGALVDETVVWTARQDLVPHHDVEVVVQPMPESQRRALAGLFASAPHEADAAGTFRVTLPDTGWTRAESEQWLSTGFNRTLMPNMAIHEVAPGHASHFRALRRAATDVRRTLHSDAFIEGWAHYCEELALEQGFRDGDPRVAVAVAQDGLRRVTCFACAIGLHTGAMTLPDAVARFTQDVSPAGPAALHEAERGLFDRGYGRYTWGKFAVLDLREEARTRWGGDFSLRRFRSALFDLGAPPLGLLHTALERG